MILLGMTSTGQHSSLFKRIS